MKRRFLILSIPFALSALLSACALNGLFLAPYKLYADDSYTQYVEKYNDSLTLSFNPDRSPRILNSSHDIVDLPYTVESIFIETSHETAMHAWFMKPKNNYSGTTLYFLHGNAGNLVYNYALASPFVEAGYQVFIIDYSGFGFSEGKAKRKNVPTDANDGLAYLLQRKDIENDKLIIYGQSLGGHLAAVIATQNQDKIDGVVIEGAFSSHKDIANEHVPFLGRIFTREMYSAKKNLPFLTKPILIIHSTEDQVIPYEEALVLFEAAKQPKSLYTIDKPHVRGPLFYLDSIVSRIDKMPKSR